VIGGVAIKVTIGGFLVASGDVLLEVLGLEDVV
jgi:hypothetical protein